MDIEYGKSEFKYRVSVRHDYGASTILVQYRPERLESMARLVEERGGDLAIGLPHDYVRDVVHGFDPMSFYSPEKHPKNTAPNVEIVIGSILPMDPNNLNIATGEPFVRVWIGEGFTGYSEFDTHYVRATLYEYSVDASGQARLERSREQIFTKNIPDVEPDNVWEKWATPSQDEVKKYVAQHLRISPIEHIRKLAKPLIDRECELAEAGRIMHGPALDGDLRQLWKFNPEIRISNSVARVDAEVKSSELSV